MQTIHLLFCQQAHIAFQQKAYESNEREIELINDLLQIAQLDAGKIVLQKTPTDIGELIEDVIDEQIDKFKARKQHVILELPKETKILDIDAVRFRMVVENLIDNASKYTPPKGTITASVKRDGKYCKISIKDTGVGITKANIAKLFEKFTRISNPLTRDVQGSGLGLYWADKIVKLHKGKIKVESVPNKGTVFNILIPTKEK